MFNWISIIIGGVTGFILGSFDVYINNPLFWVILLPIVIASNFIEMNIRS